MIDKLEKKYLARVNNIYYNIFAQEILKNVSLKINERDFITIIGPNGAGKTTLLKIILEITKPTKGNVDKHPKLNIGYVPQKLHIDSAMPISVEYFLKLCNKVKKSNFIEILENFNIIHILYKSIHDLSGGELQKLLIVKALMNNPNLLILDEPEQNLDISGQIAFYKMINKIYKERKIAILMVSHHLHMVMSVTKNVICLYKHICCSGAPDIIMKKPEFISIFGEDMSEFISVYNHLHNHKHV